MHIAGVARHHREGYPCGRPVARAIHWQLEPASHQIRAVLFDFDGTLVDSEALHHASWLAAAEPWGVSVGWTEYKERLVGISDTRACEFFLRRAGLEPTPERLEEGRSRKHRAYRSRALDELAIQPAVLDWIRSRSRRVPMGVVSSSAIPDVVPVLERQGAADLLRFVICGDHVERLKPDPMPYLLALAKIRTAVESVAPRECLVFEDSDTGVQAAAAACMTVHALASPDELPGALESWAGRIDRAGTNGA